MGGECTHCGHPHEALPRCPVTGAPSRRTGPVGSAFGGYVLERWIGGGGFAGVYRARDPRTGEAVALKLLHIERMYQADSHERLLRESRTAGALSHPHVVRVLDAGVGDDERPFVVMELIEGQDLQTVLDEEVALSPERTLRIVLQILDALEHAHALGIVHRDIKPANVMLEGGRDFVKLLDFGLSTLPAQMDSTRITGTGMAMGTPGYMSPEQHMSTHGVDHRTDLYSVAVILFRALSGRLPFEAETHAQLVLEVFTKSPPPLDTVVRGLPDWLCATVDRGLARDRDARWPSAVEFAAALRAEPAPAVAPTLLLTDAPSSPGETISGAAATMMAPSPASAAGRPSSSRVRGAFIGREAQLAELARMFDDGARLVTLLGPGGVGKTRLAQRFAGADATVVELAEQRTHGEVCSATLRALGEGLGPDPEGAVARVLSHRGEGLLLLDNVEQVVDVAAPAIARWAEEASGWRILVTSQRRLDVAAERALELPPLPLPARGDDPLAADAVQLLVDRVRRQRRDYAPDPAEAERLAALATLLDGIPLALELAAPRLAMLGATELLRRMKDRFGALSAAPDASGRHRTLLEAIRWSWELLSEPERSALAQCSVFRGGFTAVAAEEVLARDPSLPTLDALTALRDRSLLYLTPAQGDAGPRLGCYQSIREFAAARLRERGEQDATRLRHAAHYTRRCYRVAEIDDPDRPEPQRNAELAREADNLVEAVRFLAGGRAITPQDATLTAMGLIAFASATNYGLDVTLAAELFDDVLLRVEAALPVHFRARLFRARGLLSMALGDFAGSAEHFERAREEATIQGDAEMAGLAMLGRGTVLSQLGRAEEGRALIETSIELLRRSDDIGAKALALARLGVVEFVAQNLDRARAALEEAIDMLEQTGHTHLLGKAHCNLGLTLQRQGELDRCASCYEKAIAYSRESGSHVSHAFALGTFASLRHIQGRLDEAAALFEQAGQIAEPHPTYHRRVIAGYRALLDMERGDAAAARAHLAMAAPKVEAPSDDDRWIYRSFRAVLPALEGDLDRSERELESLLAEVPEDAYRDRTIVVAQRGHALAARGQTAEAERLAATLATPGPNGEPAPVTNSLEARLALRLLQSAIAKS